MAISDERPLRRDAERNRRRLLEAARELFAQRGLDVTMDQIAHHAGVGVGTAYRRFGSRDEIIDALFEDRMERVVELAEDALLVEDPWTALAGFVERLVALQATDRGLKELMSAHRHDCRRVADARHRVTAPLSELVRRARESGAVRPDVSESDIAVLSVMLGSAMDFSQHVEPELWRRYLPVLLEGLRGDEPLPVPPLDLPGVEQALETWRPRRR